MLVFQSEANDSFLRSVRDGNLNLVLEHLDYAGVHVTTSNAVRIHRYIVHRSVITPGRPNYNDDCRHRL